MQDAGSWVLGVICEVGFRMLGAGCWASSVRWNAGYWELDVVRQAMSRVWQGADGTERKEQFIDVM